MVKTVACTICNKHSIVTICFQERHQAPWMHFPPSCFRHIHVDSFTVSLVDLLRVGAVDVRGDAAVMTNTVANVWEVRLSSYRVCRGRYHA